MTGMEGTIVAVAGTICGLTIRELPAIILEKVFMYPHKTKKGEVVSTNGSAARIQLREDVKEVFVDTLKQDILPVLNQQTMILSQIAKTNSDMKDGILVLVDRGNKRGR
jgi:hypothetical protein